MPGYQVKFETITVGGWDYRIRSLLDLQQYADPLGDAERVGISPAHWALFGHIWPSARVLALVMHQRELAGRTILELGAGLGLASLVIHRRAGNVTASDRHPLSHAFLDANLLLNQLGPMKHRPGNWGGLNPGLGRFDLIIGSDVLYERQQPVQLAAFVARHATPSAEVVIVDPDRGNRVGFCREMLRFGFAYQARRAEPVMENGDAFKGCVLTFRRAPERLRLTARVLPR